jgi:sugar lactone lactonase YvrE
MALRRPQVAALFCFVGLTACGGSGEDGAAPSATTDAEPALRLPYDVEVDQEGRVYIADGGLHQVLRFDPGTGELSVVAGTGQPGSEGDGGPAAAAKVNEPVGLALASDGTLFLSDFPAGRVRRIDPAGMITTVARLRQPAEVALDGTERYLAVPSLADVLHRVDLATGKIDTLARPEEPHGAAYDEAGDLYFPDGNYIRKLDRRAGRVATIAGNGQREATGDGGPARDAGVDAVKLVVAPDGSLYVVGGDLYGGTVRRISPDGTIEAVVGSGTLGANGDGGPALDAGIQPSGVALAPDGSLIVSQIEPEAAIRRVDPETGVITTLVS